MARLEALEVFPEEVVDPVALQAVLSIYPRGHHGSRDEEDDGDGEENDGAPHGVSFHERGWLN